MARTKNKDSKKVKVDFSQLKPIVTMEVLGKEVEVRSFIDYTEQQYLISKYLQILFTRDVPTFSEYSARDRFLAETSLRHDIWTRMTNIQFELVGEGRPEAPEELMFNDSLFYSLISKISNWESFEKFLYMTVEDVEKEMYIASSLGNVVDDLVERMLEWVKKMEGVNLDKLPEIIKEMGEAVKDSKISSLMDEAKKA